MTRRWAWTTPACATCSRRASGARRRTRRASCSSRRPAPAPSSAAGSTSRRSSPSRVRSGPCCLRAGRHAGGRLLLRAPSPCRMNTAGAVRSYQAACQGLGRGACLHCRRRAPRVPPPAASRLTLAAPAVHPTPRSGRHALPGRAVARRLGRQVRLQRAARDVGAGAPPVAQVLQGHRLGAGREQRVPVRAPRKPCRRLLCPRCVSTGCPGRGAGRGRRAPVTAAALAGWRAAARAGWALAGVRRARGRPGRRVPARMFSSCRPCVPRSDPACAPPEHPRAASGPPSSTTAPRRRAGTCR